MHLLMRVALLYYGAMLAETAPKGSVPLISSHLPEPIALGEEDDDVLVEDDDVLVVDENGGPLYAKAGSAFDILDGVGIEQGLSQASSAAPPSAQEAPSQDSPSASSGSGRQLQAPSLGSPSASSGPARQQLLHRYGQCFLQSSVTGKRYKVSGPSDTLSCEKPFKCRVCSASFATSQARGSHESLKHTDYVSEAEKVQGSEFWKRAQRRNMEAQRRKTDEGENADEGEGHEDAEAVEEQVQEPCGV